MRDAVAAESPTVPQTTEPGSAWRFRPDVEGLRAIAILAVVGYHAGIPYLRGGFVGVDVFFVISGFLITGLLVTELRSTGRVSLARFWARRARRLLPAATVVLVVVAAVSWWVIPALDHNSVGLDVTASALYVANMRFAVQATDYLAAEASPSPVLHFWSLGVEEQFYLVWPLLMMATAWLAVRRTRARAASAVATVDAAAAAGTGRDGERARPVSLRWLAGSLAALGVASFALSLRLTDRIEPWAFFGMPTRAWEFAIGGLLAIGAVHLGRLPSLLRRALGWSGAALLLGSIVLITAEQPYPGTAALWPVLGTGALIAAGVTAADRTGGVPWLLSTGPMRAIGRLSYSWYLWHWPGLVFAVAVWGELGTPVLVLIAGLTLVPSVLTYRYVEQPVRHRPSLVSSPSRSLRLGAALSGAAAAAGIALALLPGGGALASGIALPVAGGDEGGERPVATETPPASSPRPSSSASPSSSAATIVWPTGPITPDPSEARRDLPTIYSDGCHLVIADTTSPTCAFGDTKSDTTVVLFGDSHAAQWFPALERLAKKNGWRLLSRTKSACTASDVTIYQRKFKRAFDECDTWRESVIAELTGSSRPALVIAAGTRTASIVDRKTGELIEESAAGQEWQDGWMRTLDRFEEAGVSVAVMRDTPWPGSDVAVCVSKNESKPSKCDSKRTVLDSPAYDVGMTVGYTNAHGVDLSDVLCTPTVCPATLGKYLVYRDDNHLTATFAEALAPHLEPQLLPLLP